MAEVLQNVLPVFTVLNAAPAVADLDKEFYAFSDIFCVNEIEVNLYCLT